ncbi:O-methyltransferase [bacterium BMS3Abin03]|jgi:predicted O-methyltransferase YrrM|nr:O-methyltransferase [bacterium BMS3Abin03]MCG6958585.1 O-methyltransferase [bacterium BMS3Abin03]
MDETIFSKVDDYLIDLFSLDDDVLKRVRESIKENEMPEISVSANQGQFLYMMAKLCNAKQILEIGALGGYSTIWLARALDGNGKLTSIELELKHAEVAKENIARAGLSDKVEILVGDALKILPELVKDKMLTDLIFIDAEKTQYVSYFNYAVKLAKKGTVIIADNVIREGQILEENSSDEMVNGAKKYNEMLSKSDKVITSIVQQVGKKAYDGMAISIVK